MSMRSKISIVCVTLFFIVIGATVSSTIRQRQEKQKEKDAAEQLSNRVEEQRRQAETKLANERYDKVTQETAEGFPEGPWRLLYLNCRHIARYHQRWINDVGIAEFLKNANPSALPKIEMWQAQCLLDLAACEKKIACLNLLVAHVDGGGH